MREQGQASWHWQQEGTSWRGVGIYHVTLAVPSRESLLGRLDIPNGDPAKARVEQTELGWALLNCQRSVATFHPEIQILQYCLMPDHLHSIWYVRRPMEQSIRYVALGFWRAAKKLGRAYTYLNARYPAAKLSACATDETRAAKLSACATDETQAAKLSACATDETGRPALSSIAPPESRDNPLRHYLGGEVYRHLFPIFTEMPFIRPMSRRGQLQAMIRYVQLNPQRLATKRLMPGFFRVQEGIAIGRHTYTGVGNVALLQAPHFGTVHVRRTMVYEAAQGQTQPLRDYMNGCVIAARRGAVMVSPFISPKEKDVLSVLLREEHPVIVLADNGFRDYYKPPSGLFDGVASGRVLILSPWEHDAGKRHISRTDCVALNTMAEEIAEDIDIKPSTPK
ncbi:MAG: hypothetical protein IJ612_07605 [Prevotella sp.]|nr:hypothetical protein [Prevotella sp.]